MLQAWFICCIAEKKNYCKATRFGIGQRMTLMAPKFIGRCVGLGQGSEAAWDVVINGADALCNQGRREWLGSSCRRGPAAAPSALPPGLGWCLILRGTDAWKRSLLGSSSRSLPWINCFFIIVTHGEQDFVCFVENIDIFSKERFCMLYQLGSASVSWGSCNKLLANWVA